MNIYYNGLPSLLSEALARIDGDLGNEEPEAIIEEEDIERIDTDTEPTSEDESANENGSLDDESIEYDDGSLDDIMEIMDEQNRPYLDVPKKTGDYCIGMCSPRGKQFLVANTLSPHLFLQVPYEYTFRYLFDYCGIYIDAPSVDIIKIKVLYDGSYIGVKKTFWLRIIQRTWKRIMRQRREIVCKRGTLTAQMMFSLTGRYPRGLNVMPRLAGSVR